MRPLRAVYKSLRDDPREFTLGGELSEGWFVVEYELPVPGRDVLMSFVGDVQWNSQERVIELNVVAISSPRFLRWEGELEFFAALTDEVGAAVRDQCPTGLLCTFPAETNNDIRRLPGYYAQFLCPKGRKVTDIQRDFTVALEWATQALVLTRPVCRSLERKVVPSGTLRRKLLSTEIAVGDFPYLDYEGQGSRFPDEVPYGDYYPVGLEYAH